MPAFAVFDPGEPAPFWYGPGSRSADPLASLGRVEGGDGIIEGRDVADVRPQPSVPHPLHDLTQLGTIGLDNEIDRQAVGGPRLGRPTTDTSVPPARTRPADRFWMSPERLASLAACGSGRSTSFIPAVPAAAWPVTAIYSI